MTDYALLQLQQAIGNRAVGRLLQTKLKISEPGDQYEQEADQLAEQVMRMPELQVQRQPSDEEEDELVQAKPFSGQPAGPLIQRKCSACASGGGLCPKCAEEESLQRKPLAASIAPLLQRQPAKPEEEEEGELLQSKEPPGHTPEGATKVAANLSTLRGGGQPLPPSVRSFFEPRFGENFSGVRVHADGWAAETARDLQARAFTMGRDVVFGPGEYAPESAAGRRLLAHELTHVVQQSQRHPTLQAKIQRQANEVASDAVATPERAGPGVIVDDSAVELNPGQMRKSEFLAELRAEVCAAADEALAGTGRNTEGCPYLDSWFDYYRDKDARHCERSLRKFAPEAARATTAREYIPVVAGRVRRSVATWARTGEITGVPEELRSAIIGGNILSAMGSVASGIGDAVSSLAGGIGKGLSAAGGLFFKARAGGPNNVGDPQAIQAQLGAGNPLDGGVRSRMGTAFGYDFSKVRVHRDSTAADMANRFNARAFTVGNHVAFGSGEYQPGTLAGAAILAHELAHVAQQTSSNATSSGNSVDQALEGDADMSAAMVVTGLLGSAGRVFSLRGARPGLKSGLRLSRCNSDKGKASPNWTVDDMKKMLDTCDGGLGIWAKAKKANNDNDPIVKVGKTRSGGVTSGDTITIEETSDLCTATQVLIQELSNMSRAKDFDKLSSDALAGDLAREDFIKGFEKIEYETGVKNVLTAFDACKDIWKCQTAEKEWARKAKDFDDYFDKFLNDTHKEGYGKWWDDNCKAAYDKKHGKK